MAKPILVVQIPFIAPPSEESSAVKEVLKTETDNEYHVILYYSQFLTDFKCEVLNYQGEEPINEEELEQKILSTINNNK